MQKQYDKQYEAVTKVNTTNSTFNITLELYTSLLFTSSSQHNAGLQILTSVNDGIWFQVFNCSQIVNFFGKKNFSVYQLYSS